MTVHLPSTRPYGCGRGGFGFSADLVETLYIDERSAFGSTTV